MHAVLLHLREPTRALQEIKRVLKPGGLIGIRSDDMDGLLIAPPSPLLLLTGPPDVLAACLRTLAQAGVAHVQVFLHPSTYAAVEAFAPVLDILDRERISAPYSQDQGETK